MPSAASSTNIISTFYDRKIQQKPQKKFDKLRPMTANYSRIQKSNHRELPAIG